MKKFFSVAAFLFWALGTAGVAKAQITDSIMPLKDGNFEVWVDYPGDTVTFIVPIPVNDPYSLPEGWHAPMFKIDDTVEYSGMTLPLNVSLPVAKVSRDTLGVPQGQSGLIAESFLLSDVLSPVASLVVGQMLDSALMTEVIPSIVTNAEVDLMKILPLMEQVAEDPSDLSWLLELVDSIDLNELMNGGAPLNGFEPKLLHGMYKYLDGNGSGLVDDNATLVMLGTCYDPVLNKRMLVGAGSKNLFQRVDTVHYDRFDMDYYTLNEYYPEQYAFAKADTVVVIAISSANEKKRARGSKLYLDSLVLRQRDESCGRITDVRLDNSSTVHAVVKWNSTVVPDKWMVEYGEAGFYRGYGMRFTVTDSVATMVNLTPNTTYDFYVRSECGDTSTSTWGYLQFTTDSLTPHSVQEVEAERVKLTPNPARGRCEVDFGGLSVSRVSLYSINGQMLMQRPVMGKDVTLDLPGKGVYVVELLTPQGAVHKRVVND